MFLRGGTDMEFRKISKPLTEIGDTQKNKTLSNSSENDSQIPIIKTPFSSDVFKQNLDIRKTSDSPRIEQATSPEIKYPMKNRQSRIEQLIEQKLQEKKASSLINTEQHGLNYSKDVQKLRDTTTESANNTTKNIGERTCNNTENIASKSENVQKFPSKFKSVILETPNYDFIETSKNPKNQCNIADIQTKKKQKKRFRAKFSIILYTVVLIICAGWTIFNGIQISNTSHEIARIEYSIDSFNYIIKIDQLKIINEQENSIITNVIEVTPPPLTEPTQIQPHTNWFDRLCSWLSNLFK